ncbi:MAG TPA: phosphate acyltransferase PlsX [Anaerolineae bacterium]|nr:phosphate acyltransferase PlsX [Anaerolineae bacterium]
MKIVLDAMGGDHAPVVVIAGAVDAAREFAVPIVLVGQETVIRGELAKYDTSGLDLSVVHASQVVDMHDKPSDVLRSKPESSMHIGMEMVRQGEADAFVTCGNTGGALAIALVKLGRIKVDSQRRIHRPTLATKYPTRTGFCFFMDTGANTDWKPVFLQQSAVMGSIYAESVLDVPNPRVGLVSIGEEEGKGNIAVREAYDLINATPGLNFVGNLEGKDIPAGKADVVVTDGFTGNVIIKLSEGVASLIIDSLREEITSRTLAKIGALLAKPALSAVARKLDYAEYGGAVLLGLNHICIVGHGRSNARAVRSAIKVARDAVQANVIEEIRQGLANRPVVLAESE